MADCHPVMYLPTIQGRRLGLWGPKPPKRRRSPLKLER